MEELSRKSFDPNQNEFWQGYHFDYDAWGNTTEIQVWKPTSGTAATPTGDTASLATYQYNVNGTLARMNYPSGQYVTYEYDLLDRLVKEVYYNIDDSIQVEYQYIYSSDGQLAKQQAIRNGTVVESYRFEYDSLGRLIRSREGEDNNLVQRTEHLYDSANRLTNQNWVVGERSFTESYTYNTADGTMASMLATYDDGSGWVARNKLTYTYDDLNRLTQVLDTENYSTQFYTRNYTYQDLSGDRTTSRLAQYVYRKPSDSSIINGNSYAYDANGNITQINEVYTVNGADASRTLAVYTYDDLNQLTQETRYTYAGTSTTPAATTTVNYTVDTAGNLRSVTGGEHSVSYTYADTAWSDKLTGITVDGVTRTITYADAANPFNWFNGTDYTNLTWTQGRRLSNVTKGSQTYSYEYDMSGVRSVKIADGLRHEYVTQNGRVVRESVYGLNSNTGEYTVFQYALDFVYDESGHPFLMRRYYNEAQTNYNTYHYVLNAQGDVIKLLHGSNTTVAEYSYDAWGNILYSSGNLADVNPLRYRGYYYDTETGFYYLQSRYYDPIVKRFLNADSYASTGQGFLGYNMFAYCGNCPACFSDYSGCSIQPTTYYCSDATYGSLTPDFPSTNSRKMKTRALQIRDEIATEASWRRMTTDQRKACCEELFSKMCELMQISNYSMVLSDEIFADTAGTTNKLYCRITIYDSNNAINDYEVLGTILHECYHAYQYNCVEGILNGAEPKYVVEAWRATFNSIESIPYMQRYTEISAYWFEDNLDYAYYDGCHGRGYYR